MRREWLAFATPIVASDDDPGDGECERRSADLREPAGEEAADRCEPEEREQIEADQAPRRWSGAESWTSALAFAVKSVKATPIPKSSDPAS